MKGGNNMSIFICYKTPQRNEKFRNKLIEERGHQCECCKLTNWLDLPINLELHHKDGNRLNYCRNNLQLLCPNCHSHTDNYGSKNKKHNDISDEELIQALKISSSIRKALFSLGLSDAGANYNRARKLINDYNLVLLKTESKAKEIFCIDCGKPIYPGSTRCIQCEAKTRQTFEVSREELKDLIRTTPFTKIGEQFGVSDNTIRKWCDKYNLPRKASEIKKISDEVWKII